MLSSLVDYKDDEWDLDSPVRLPIQSLLVTLKGFSKELAGLEENAEFSLPRMKDREDLAEESELLLSDMIVLNALSQSKLIETNFEQWIAALGPKIFGSWDIKSLIKKGLIDSPSEWLLEILNNHGKDYDPTTIVDHIERIAIKQAKIHNLDVDAALQLLDKVDQYRRRWSIATVKARREEMAREKASPIFRYILENAGRRSNLSYLKERPYWSR